MAQNWNIIHIVITDGDDGGSNYQMSDVVKNISQISKLTTVKSSLLMIIGLDPYENVAKQLKNISVAAGDNG